MTPITPFAGVGSAAPTFKTRASRRSFFRRPALSLLLVSLIVGCKSEPPAAEGDKHPEDVAVETVAAENRTMEVTVTAQGTLAPAQGAFARVAAQTPGRLVSVLAREGQFVTAGQVIAMIDSRAQHAQTKSASAALAASLAQQTSAALAVRASAADQASGVHLAELTLKSAQAERDSSVLQAETALQAAQTDLQKTRAGARPQEIAQAVQAVNQATATRSRAAAELDRVRFLFEKGIDSRRQLDDAETALSVADSALASAKESESLVRAGARQEDLRAAEIRVTQARQALDLARTSGAARVSQAEAALIQARQAALQVAVKRQDARAAEQLADQKRAELATAQAGLALTSVRSPFSGTVTRRMLNSGDSADPTTPILELSENGSLNLIANVLPAEGARLKIGMSARITSADIPGVTFPGQVLSIGQIDPQTNLMTVRISVDNARGTLRSGLFVTAEIVVQTLHNAITVPKQAIVTREGKSIVFIVGPDNIAHMREVTAGVEQGGRVALSKGAAAGDNVIRLGQYEIAEGQKVHEIARDTESKGSETDGKQADSSADKAGANRGKP